jgi:phosphate transport system substrate-binding protein
MGKCSVKSYLCAMLIIGLIIGLSSCSTISSLFTQDTATISNKESTQNTDNESSKSTTKDTEATEAPVTPVPIDLPDDFPIIDSSTARISITAALYSLFVDEYGLTGPEPICSKTHGAWTNLADGTVDLIFAVAPTEEERDYLYEKGVDIEMRLYGCDGLVFMGNAQNPVKNLTNEQIKDIYRGEITNWSELGGPDAKINAIYRDPQSGSQRLFESIVWKDEELPDLSALSMYQSDGMDDITDWVISDPYAIGFNIMSYINIEYHDDNLMLFSVDGVAPSTETLEDASYPYITQAYLIIRADEPEDSSARWMFNWFGSDKSKEILQSNSSLSLIFSDPILFKTSEKP